MEKRRTPQREMDSASQHLPVNVCERGGDDESTPAPGREGRSGGWCG